MKEVLTVRVQFSKDLQYKWHFKILSKLHKASKIEKKFKYDECCKFNFKHLNASPKFQNNTAAKWKGNYTHGNFFNFLNVPLRQ